MTLRSMRRVFNAALVSLLAVAAAGCMNPFVSRTSVQAASDKVTVYLAAGDGSGNSLGARTIMPPQPSLSSYALLGGPRGGAQDSIATFASLSGATLVLDPGTYDFTLLGKDAYGTTVLSGSLDDQSLTTSPASLAFTLRPLASGLGSVQIDLSWPAGSGVASVATSFDGSAVLPALAISDNAVRFSRTGETNGAKLLSFRLLDGNGAALAVVSELVWVIPNLQSSATIALSGADLNAPPAAPSSPIAGSVANTSDPTVSVLFSWTDGSDNESGFEVWTADGTTRLADLAAATTSWTATGVARGSTVSYRVRAKNDFGNSSWSGSVSATTPWLVSFDSNGGSAVSGIEVADNGHLASLPAPTKASYGLAGWYTDSGLTAPFTLSSVVTGSMTVYAKWVASHIVSFAPEGGSGTMADQSIGEGTSAALTSNSFTRTNYRFMGWATVAGGAVAYADGAGYSMGLSDVTLYAVWNQLHSVSYNMNGATGGSAPSDGNGYVQGETITARGNTGGMTYGGYQFVGWNEAANGSGLPHASGDTFAMGTSNVVLYAQWVAVYGITYNANGGTGSVPVDGNSYLSGSFITVAGNSGNLASGSSVFSSWNTISGGTGDAYMPSDTIQANANIILYAQYINSSAVKTVTYTTTGSTGGAAPVDSNKYYNGAYALVLGNTGNLVNSGSTFVGWTDGTSNFQAGDSIAITNSNVSLAPVWTTLATYTVAYASGGATSGTVPTDTSNYLSGTRVTVKPNSGLLVKTNCYFAGWSPDGGTTLYPANSFFVIGSANATLTAVWKDASSSTYAVGSDGPGGGKVIYVNPNYLIDGWRYLEAKVTDDNTGIQWSNKTNVNIGGGKNGSLTSVGGGFVNQSWVLSWLTINASKGVTADAVSLCAALTTAGFRDWYLPDSGELALMYQNRTILGSPNNDYWSSTEGSANAAVTVNLGNNGVTKVVKTQSKYIRAIRRF